MNGGTSGHILAPGLALCSAPVYPATAPDQSQVYMLFSTALTGIWMCECGRLKGGLMRWTRFHCTASDAFGTDADRTGCEDSSVD
jgi:hypothetical protein